VTAEPVSIPLQRLARQGFIVPGAEPVRTLNEFRMIKRPLIFNVTRRKAPALANARRIMVTSALPGEGKTFCAVNLALSIADERDHGVLLVDADVARPTIPATLGIPPRPGLMDVLVDPAIDVAGLVAATSIDNLSLLTAGSHHAKATELLASAAMNRLLERLTFKFPDRIIIFDSPPLLATTEASVLAVHMGQIVLVVEAGRTQRGVVAAALASLEGAPGEISTLMNKAPPRRKSEFLPYGGYGYGYEARV
jgi:receptor protein-tyrosine kinase